MIWAVIGMIIAYAVTFFMAVYATIKDVNLYANKGTRHMVIEEFKSTMPYDVLLRKFFKCNMREWSLFAMGLTSGAIIVWVLL